MKNKYIKPRIAMCEIMIAFNSFEEEEAKRRIKKYIETIIDDAESQFNKGVTSAYNSGINDGANAAATDILNK